MQMDEQGRPDLPEGWEYISFDRAVSIISTTDRKVKQRDYLSSGALPVIDQGQEFINGYTDEIEKQIECQLPVIVFGDHTRILKFVNFAFVAGADGIKIIKPLDIFNPKLFYYFLQALELPDRGYGRHFQFLRKTTMPIPPLPEQHRIVEAIESYFTRLDAVVAALERVQRNLARYKAAVLQAACTGRLVPTNTGRGEAVPPSTDNTRHVGMQRPLVNQAPVGDCLAPTHATHAPMPDESADGLLARILAERRARWEADHPGKRYVEPAPPDTDGLPDLPEGWCWATVEQIGDVMGGLTKNTKRAVLPLQLPYLRVANVYADKLKLDDVQKIGVEEKELDRLLLKKGDLLVVEGNGSVDQIGRVAIWNGMIDPCVHQNHIIKIRLELTEIGRFALLWLLSLGGRDQIVRVASSTSGLYTLSISKVAALPIPLPPLAEQRRIVAEVERRFSVVQEVETVIETNLARAARLRQAILRDAFAGRLVAR